MSVTSLPVSVLSLSLLFTFSFPSHTDSPPSLSWVLTQINRDTWSHKFLGSSFIQLCLPISVLLLKQWEFSVRCVSTSTSVQTIFCIDFHLYERKKIWIDVDNTFWSLWSFQFLHWNRKRLDFLDLWFKNTTYIIKYNPETWSHTICAKSRFLSATLNLIKYHFKGRKVEE